MNRSYATIVFNGEIYNFRECRKSLEKLGETFSSGSDTEVLLAGYLKWGIEHLLERIDGMFAFALYDEHLNTIFLCRDRLGKKPLYYYNNGEEFYFSSEIRSICKVVSELTVNFRAIDYYLSELAVPQPHSIWNEVKQVEPATYLTINTSGKIIQRSYYKFAIARNLELSEKEILRLLKDKLTAAILLRTVADVPIGCYLSGGVDSGLIVSLLATNSSDRVKTFSVGFLESEYNELNDAKKVALRYSTEHQEIIVDPTASVNVIEDLLDYIGEPFADPSIIPTYLISREISSNVKVALSGDGGDEIFGGYGEFMTSYGADLYRFRHKSRIEQEIMSLTGSMKRKMFGRKNDNSLYNSFLKQDGEERLSKYMGFNQTQKRHLYNGKFAPFRDFTGEFINDKWEKNKSKHLTDELFLTMMETRLLNNYLVKVDRMSMINSLEVRSPFLDTKLIEFAFSIPLNILFGSGCSAKYLLKKLAEKLLDENVFSKKKKGFELPVRSWLRNELAGYVKSYLMSDSFRSQKLFNHKYVSHILNRHVSGHEDHTYRVWALLCMEVWRAKNKVDFNHL